MDGDCDGSHNTDDDEKSNINKKTGTEKSTQRAEKEKKTSEKQQTKMDMDEERKGGKNEIGQNDKSEKDKEA